MSSAIIKMKRGSETDLAEVSKSILDDFKGDVAELSLEQMSEVNGVKVQQATIIGTGGGEGLMNISLGANQDFARRVAKVLAKLGFEEIRS